MTSLLSMNKKIVGIVLLVIIGLFGVSLFRFTGKGNNSHVIPPTPTVMPASQETVLHAITEEFSKKYNKPLSDFIIAVNTDVGNYAKGSVSLKGEGGGGLWFAAKVKNRWQLVYDGNGIIPCSDLRQYPDFPSSLIPQCFDDEKNVLIER